MIKIRLNENRLLTEASTRYLMERFKLPKEFAEWLNSEYRQTADVLAELFVIYKKRNYSVFDDKQPFNLNVDADLDSQKYKFNSFLSYSEAGVVNDLLKIAPKEKAKILELANSEGGIDAAVSYAKEKFELYDFEQDKKKTSIKFPNGYYWVDTGKTYCSREAKHMHHCGQAAYGGTLYSLRNKHDRPELTIEMNAAKHEIYQMFHFNNQLPPDKYIPYLKKFVEFYQVPAKGLTLKFGHDAGRLAEIIFELYYEGDRSYENMFKYIESRIPEDKEYRNSKENIQFFKSSIKTLTSNNELSLDQYFQTFVLFMKGTTDDGKAHSGNFESFFQAANFADKSDEFKAELLEKIVDYFEETNFFKVGDSGIVKSIVAFIKKSVISIYKKDSEYGRVEDLLPPDELKAKLEIYKNANFIHKLNDIEERLAYKERIDDILTFSQYYSAESAINIFPQYLKNEKTSLEEAAYRFLEEFKPRKFGDRLQFVEWLFTNHTQLFNNLKVVKRGMRNLIQWSERDSDKDEEDMNKSDIYNKLKSAREKLESEPQKVNESRIRVIINSKSRKY